MSNAIELTREDMIERAKDLYMQHHFQFPREERSRLYISHCIGNRFVDVREFGNTAHAVRYTFEELLNVQQKKNTGGYLKNDHYEMKQRAIKCYVEDMCPTAEEIENLTVVVMNDFEGNGHVAVHIHERVETEIQYTFKELSEL